MRSYNDTYHRSIGMAPSEVRSTNQEIMWQRLYGHESVATPKFIVGDRGRMGKVKRHFEKDTWRTGQKNCLRLLSRTNPTHPCIVRSIGTVINWTVRSTNRNYRRSSYRRAIRIELSPSYGGVTSEVLVKWSGYPTSFNSWIDAKTLVNYQRSRYNVRAITGHVSHARCRICGGSVSALLAEHHTDTSADI